jgi:alpha-1,2-mannosyltransferase
MQNFLSSIESGDWLTQERQRVYGLMLLIASLLFLAAMVASTHDRMMGEHNQLGTDFSQVWVAGKEALEGAPEAVFDIKRHVARQRAEFGADAAVYGWHYPPYFLGVAALLARLPYLPALALWQGVTLAAYVVVIALLARAQKLDLRQCLFAALAFPAVMVNLGHGQNGFLTAALLGGGFLVLEKRPLLAGVLFALLAYKPQFAFVLPLALVLDRRWRTIAATAATLALTTLASVAAFGVSSWRAFFEGLAFTQKFVVEQGAAGFEKIQSPFAAVRLLGGDVTLAYAVQAIVAAAALGALFWLWRSDADRRAKIAATLTATLLTTPYCLDYDMMALTPALALLAGLGAEKGFAPYEKTALAVAFVAPLAARPLAAAIGLPLGVLVVTLLFCAILQRGVRTSEARVPSAQPA